METNGLIATAHLTVNGQSLTVEINRLGDTIEGAQRSTYWTRSGLVESIKGFGGYKSDRIHLASNRTIANAIERYIETNYS